ncbi:MAG: PhzF family phenazine biosynthesis protein [Pseudomonadota bacterium]
MTVASAQMNVGQKHKGVAMPEYSFDWVDAFADRPMAGNPCVVVYDAASIPVPDRIALVRETRLSECAYLVPSDVADFGARYYLAGREIPMAGHPTIATVLSLVDRGHVAIGEPTRFTLEVGAGVIPIEVSGPTQQPRISLTLPAPQFGLRCDPVEIAAIYGLRQDDIVGTPQLVDAGAGHVIALLRSAEALVGAQLDIDKLHGWQAALDVPGAGDIEVYLAVLSGEGTEARLLLPPPMPPEDPFTGSATGEMAAYLWHHGLIDTPRFVARQGHHMGRPGQAEVELIGTPDAISGVRLTGCGVVLMRGTLTF